MTDETNSGSQIVDVTNKAAPTPVLAPAPPEKPRNYVLELSRNGQTITQEYASEDQRDQYFHFYDQRGYVAVAKNKNSKPPAPAPAPALTHDTGADANA